MPYGLEPDVLLPHMGSAAAPLVKGIGKFTSHQLTYAVGSALGGLDGLNQVSTEVYAVYNMWKNPDRGHPKPNLLRAVNGVANMAGNALDGAGNYGAVSTRVWAGGLVLLGASMVAKNHLLASGKAPEPNVLPLHRLPAGDAVPAMADAAAPRVQNPPPAREAVDTSAPVPASRGPLAAVAAGTSPSAPGQGARSTGSSTPLPYSPHVPVPMTMAKAAAVQAGRHRGPSRPRADSVPQRTVTPAQDTTARARTTSDPLPHGRHGVRRTGSPRI
ncbi:hypothetical protein [Streptomyces sp. NPDC050804]|uniref:hypothetical protein n=1 Tax=Streptomyces sp. NPDC050804 TaxID=3154745 RepID=UPI00341963B7